jgi:ketosteroid isomerase-like protein
MFLSIFLTGWSVADSGNDTDVASVKAFNQAYLAAQKSGNTSKIASMWAADGVLLPPGEPAVVGSSQIHAWFVRNEPDMKTVRITTDTANWRDIEVAGDYAFQWAPTYVNIRSINDDAGVHMNGTVLQVLKKQPDGSWKLLRSSWSYEGKKKDTNKSER